MSMTLRTGVLALVLALGACGGGTEAGGGTGTGDGATAGGATGGTPTGTATGGTATGETTGTPTGETTGQTTGTPTGETTGTTGTPTGETTGTTGTPTGETTGTTGTPTGETTGTTGTPTGETTGTTGTPTGETTGTTGTPTGETTGTTGTPTGETTGTPTGTPTGSTTGGNTNPCDASAFCAGAANADISPTDAQIAGIEEDRAGGQKVLQTFHLGGFGIGPFDAFGPLNDQISNPAAKRPFHVNAAGAEERTYGRVLYLTKPGSDTELVFGVIDAVGAGNLIQAGIKHAVSVATGVPESNVIIGQTHSHAAADLQGLWGGVPQDWVNNKLYTGFAAAALRAKQNARKAELTFGRGTADFNNYRRPRRERDATADKSVALLVARDTVSGAAIGSLLQYAAHPTNVGDGAGGDKGRAVHGDYVLGATQALEAALGAPAVYYNGPIADASPAGPNGADDYITARLRGEGLAARALQQFGLASTVIAPDLKLAQVTARLPITNPLFGAVAVAGGFNRYYDFTAIPFGDIPGLGPIVASQQSNLPQTTLAATTLVSRVTLGGATGDARMEIVTIPGETTNTFGQYIRSLATTPNVMLFGLTHNSFGYILPEDEFNYISEDGDAGFVLPFTGYEEWVSLGPLTATLLRIQAYNPLFNRPASENVPPTVVHCVDGSDPFAGDCFLAAQARRPDFIQRAYARQCRDNGLPETFCAMVDPETPLAQPCREAGLPEPICIALGDAEVSTDPGPPIPGKIRAGVGVVDMTANVGYCSGQYCDTTNYLDGLGGGEIDPFLHSRYKDTSYGVQSRLTARAIVVEGANQGRRIALLKTDNYLAQDHLLRRVGQLLDQGSSGIRYEDILYHVSHNHSSAYYSTPAWGVWLFQDIFDQRAFELQARSMARAIELAAARLKPARMGATTIQHPNYKGNVVRPAVADDGTPAGYPLEFGDHGLVVMRFDDITDPDHPRPLAAWMNWGEHPESLDGYALHSADYLAPLERMIEREIGAPLVFSQADVGSSENTGNSAQMLADDGSVCGQWPDGAPAPLVNACLPGQGVVRDWNHHGYVQTERNVRFLADDIVRAWEQIGTDAAQVPLSDSFEVDSRLAWTPGPLSHPYPSVSNCRTDTTLSESPGVPVAGVPDCFRDLEYPEPLSPAMIQLALIAGTMEQEGIPVPDQYDASAFTGVEENLRLKLQTVRLGDVLLASCACEAQVDLILNLESRTNDVAGDIYDGFDWACLMPEHAAEQVCEVQRKYYDRASLPTPIPGHNFDPAAIAHMRAQVHNDARGWDAPANAVAANSEPLELAEIWGNFTKEELPVERGYKLAVGVGHAGDYNGYTVSYREYQNRESYRKALTAYGPHTADYMVTRLVRMAGAMHGGPELAPEPQDVLGQVDEARQILSSTLLGAATANSYDVYEAALPDDLGPAAALTQPLSIERFDAATFTWRGGSNAIDNPTVRVERETAPGFWQKYADQTGEVQTRVVYPEGVGGIIQTWAGQTDWHWTANFEAYSSFPSRLGSTPEGNFRFVVDGRKRQDHGTVNYHLVSEPFSVSAWRGIPVTNVARGGNGDLAFDTPDRVSYPASYTSGFRFINAADAGKRICEQCTFRPWATGGDVTAATVRVVRAGGAVNFVPATRSGNRWLAPTALAAGDLATITVVDSNGNTSAAVAVE